MSSLFYKKPSFSPPHTNTGVSEEGRKKIHRKAASALSLRKPPPCADKVVKP
jgi:hypothetical protein